MFQNLKYELNAMTTRLAEKVIAEAVLQVNAMTLGAFDVIDLRRAQLQPRRVLGRRHQKRVDARLLDEKATHAGVARACDGAVPGNPTSSGDPFGVMFVVPEFRDQIAIDAQILRLSGPFESDGVGSVAQVHRHLPQRRQRYCLARSPQFYW